MPSFGPFEIVLILLYALVISGGFNYIVLPPYEFIVSWLPAK